MQKIIGSKQAKENAIIEKQEDGKIIVTWEESKETAKFTNEESFKAWANKNNRFIDRIE